MAKQGVLFASRFLESYAGQNILHSARTAIIELVANSWDAGATRVDIAWPDVKAGRSFSIEDNGCGMTSEQFEERWRTLSYDRKIEQGPMAEAPPGTILPKRTAFGRNGIGRFAGFCFGEEYFVRTWRDGHSSTYRVTKGIDVPIRIHAMKSEAEKGAGTKVFIEGESPISLSAADSRAEIGMRFLTDPNFQVSVDGQKVSFEDIDTDQIEKMTVLMPGHEPVQILVIDTKITDKTSLQHGLAWHVNGRLVGECDWRGPDYAALLDRRRIAAKRYTFIVKANCLAEAVLGDWSGFDSKDSLYGIVSEAVFERVKDFFLKSSEEDREATFKVAKTASQPVLRNMSLRGREKWKRFVDETQQACPSLRETELVQMSKVMAKLEEADSKYGLIRQLSLLRPDQLDDLHRILASWTLDMAKIVLDELDTRLKLLDELKEKVFDEKAEEVQELQPLFQRGLWIFGPEYETIEYTSNERMTTVIQRLFNVQGKGSQNRPDFVILPDGTVGFYSYPSYDAEGGEVGIDRLAVLELKKAGIAISTEQKAQCWKYVSELFREGLLQKGCRVTCFAVGSSVDAAEAEPREEKGGSVVIRPMDYATVIARAKSRTFNLYERVKNAPLFKDELRNFLDEAAELDGPVQTEAFVSQPNT